jgi:hypothetical protein
MRNRRKKRRNKRRRRRMSGEGRVVRMRTEGRIRT